MRFIAGVDAHKDSHTIVFIDDRGKAIETLTISTTDEGYERALEAARRLGGETVWAIESTGSYALGFAHLLLDCGAEVYEVPGSFTKRHRARSSRTGKSDALDAQAIAEALLREAGRLPRYEMSPVREAIRLRYDQRNRLVRQRTEAINRLRSAVLRLNHGDLPRNLAKPAGIAAVEDLIAATQGTEELVIQAFVDELRFAVEDIRRLNDRIGEIETMLRPLMRRLAPELLELRGVSTVVAAGLIGHGGSLHNCRNADAFAMRAGTAPVSCSSGKHAAVRVNYGGNRELNRLLHVMAINQIGSPDHVGRVYYDRKRSEGKTARAALRALKRRLSVVVYYRLLAAATRYEMLDRGEKAA